MSGKTALSSIGHPVAELPVKDVERAQEHYRDALGFTIEWLYPDKEIGAVTRGDVAVFFLWSLHGRVAACLGGNQPIDGHLRSSQYPRRLTQLGGGRCADAATI